MSTKDPNIFEIWNSEIDLDDWKKDIKEDINGSDYIGLAYTVEEYKKEKAEKAWDEKVEANQDRYDNIPHKQYLSEWKEFIENFDYELSDEELDTIIDENYDTVWEYIKDLNNVYLNDEFINLDRPLSNEVLCIDYGCDDNEIQEVQRTEISILNDCLHPRTKNSEEVMYFVEKDTLELRQKEYDYSTHYFTYREVKADVTEEQLDEFFDKCNADKVTQADIDKITEPMGRYVQKVYGFEVNKPEKKKDDIEKD